LNPRASVYYFKPAFSIYLATTPLPGDKLVLIYGLTVNPFSTAFLATIPAAKSTLGFDVLVQEVMDAITTEP